MKYENDLPKLKKNNPSKKFIIISVFSVLMILVTIGLSYAYYAPRIKGTDELSRIIVKTESEKLEIAGMINFDGNEIGPGIEKTLKFRVTNIGKSAISYSLIMEDVINTLIKPSEVTYEITCQNSDGSSCEGMKNSILPIEDDTLFLAETLEVNTFREYSLTVKFIDTGLNQDYNRARTLQFKMGVEL